VARIAQRFEGSIRPLKHATEDTSVIIRLPEEKP
jgi:hypothetical protein